MCISIGTNIVRLRGASFNYLESFMIENLTRNHFHNYNSLKKDLFKKKLLMIQIYQDIYIVSLDKLLKRDEIIQIIRKTMFKNTKNIKKTKNKTIIKKDLIFENNEYFINQIIPILLKNMFFNALFKKFNKNDIIINYKLNRISLKKNMNKWISFIFKFEIDNNFNIYLKIDSLYSADFEEYHSISNLPKSKERKNDNDEILQLISNIQFFCGGKSYTLDPEFLVFKKIIIEKEC